MSLRKLWIAAIVFVPIIPKVGVFEIGGSALLLDDLALLCAVALGVLDSLGSGAGRLFVSRAGVIFAALFAYKTINLFVVALVYPISHQLGRGVMFGEGVLVLSRVGALAFAYLLLYHNLRTLRDIYWAYKAYIVCVAAVVAVAIGQYFILGHPVLTSTFRNIHALGKIIPGKWGLQNPWLDPGATGHEHLGAFMVLALAVIGGGLLYQYPAGKKWRRAAVAFWMLGVFVLMMCSSRGAWVGAVLAASACCWLAMRRRKTGFICRGVFLMGLGLGGLYVAGFDFEIHVGARLEKLPALLEGKVEDNSARHRLNYLTALSKMFVDKPLAGWGAGSAGRIAEGQMQRELVEGGVIGGVLFLGLMGISAAIALKTNRLAMTHFAQGISFGYICGLIGLAGGALFTELFILPKVAAPVWLMAAMVHRLYFIEQEGLSRPPAGPIQ